MSKAQDLTGQYFGSILVLRKTSPTNQRQARWICKCLAPSCGNEFVARTHDLTSGNTKSCGCRRSKRRQTYQNNRTSRQWGWPRRKD